MKKYLLPLLSVALVGSMATAQTVTFKNAKGNSMGRTFDLNKVSRIVYNPPILINPDDVENLDMFYYPGDPNYTKSYESMFVKDSPYNFYYSKQSEHFIVFWDKQFGENPGKSPVPTNLRVDIDDLLMKAERFFDTNINKLKMADLGEGKSTLDKYKMQIWIVYSPEWLATGSGYGNTIGALWVNPSTCQPVGSTIAHEIGHSFQYQVYCDKLYQGEPDDYQSGFRYNIPGAQGCGFWEQCAQWQSFQDYPNEMFTSYNFNVWLNNYHRHFEHEWMRYASYWLQSWWVQNNGIEAFANVWKNAKYPNDAIQTYQKLYFNNNYEETVKDLYQYAAHVATFDIDNLPSLRNTKQYQGLYKTNLIGVGDNFYRVAYNRCPANTGFNVIRLDVPQGGGTVTVDFQGLAVGSPLASGDAGEQVDGDGKFVANVTTYNNFGAGTEGWAFGFVSMNSKFERQYSEMFRSTSTTEVMSASYDCPADAEYLYLIVQGAPTKYYNCPWDEKESTDFQFPYQVRVNGTDISGMISIDRNIPRHDEEVAYTLECNASLPDYVQGSLDLKSNGDLKKICQAFLLESGSLAASTQAIAAGTNKKPTKGKVTFMLEQPDGTLTGAYSANSGFYMHEDGSLGAWGQSSPIWVEYDKDNFVLTYGHQPGAAKAGQTCTCRPCLVYVDEDGAQYKFVWNLTYQF